jgi:hypothetical protein
MNKITINPYKNELSVANEGEIMARKEKVMVGKTGTNKSKTVVSKRFTLSPEQREKWIYNATKYFAVAALMFFMSIQSGATIEQSLLVIKVWAVNTIVDVLTKFVENK